MKLKTSPFAWVSFAMIVGVLGTALISPLYGLYKEAWHLKPSDISLVYVVYMGGALFSLLTLARLPDRTGFKPFMQLGLALMLSGSFICMLAGSLRVLMAGRVLVGVSSSMLITSSTLGLSTLSEGRSPQRIATVTGFLMSLGFGLGPLLGGIMGQWAPHPLVTTYIPPLLLGSLGLAVLTRLPMPPSHGSPGPGLRWRDVLPTLTWPPKGDAAAFALTTSLPFLAFGVFGLYASMSPLFLDQLVPWHGPMVSGTAIAVILIASAAVQIVASGVPTHWCGCGGLLTLVASNVLLMLNLQAGSGTLFAAGVALAATGHGLCTLAGMSMVNRIATAGQRSGLLATYLVMGYLGSMLPMMAMGWIADHWGMPAAVYSFCTAVVVAGSAAAVLFQRHHRMRS